MKLLILTQKVDKNDDLLGFFHGWIREFAKHFEKVIVIALEVGEHDLPDNVKVLSLGKELSYQLFKKSIYILKFYKYILQERRNYDTVFVHMNKEYILLGGWVWRMMGKKIGLWYAHGHVPIGLKIAEKFVHIIFTSTESGCRISSPKIKVVGQGIDVDYFKPEEKKVKSNIFKIITVSRISPSKDLVTLIKAIDILNQDNSLPNFSVEIIGGVGLNEQANYLAELKNLIKEKQLEQKINFLGSIPNNKIIQYLRDADLFVNTSLTGSLDKAMLEAMAVELPILTCNEAMLEVLGRYQDELMYPQKDSTALAAKIKKFINLNSEQRRSIGIELRNLVIKHHSLDNLIIKIIDYYG